MNTILESVTGMDKMTDQVIATDLLNSAKSGVKSYAVALTESASPEVRDTLKRHLNDAITAHEKITSYMVEKGWYNVSDFNQQIKMDLQNAQKVMNLPEK